MEESKAAKTNYFKKSVIGNLMISSSFYLMAAFNIFILKNLIAVSIGFLVLGTYRLIIAGINYLSLKKSEKNFLENKKV